MTKPSTVHRLGGLAVFVIALATYLLTLDPGPSFWDCPEYIAVGARLEVGHPPGNPLWMLLGRMAAICAPAGSEALAVNVTSALFSALTVLVLYLCIHIFSSRLWHARSPLIPVASAAVGALAFCWSDSFWFSAVEAEVYALSALFTVLSLWLMLLWSKEPDPGRRSRLLVLTAYVTGLSLGVHQLNLLCLPALALIAGYHSRANLSRWQIALLILASFVIIGILLFGMIPLSLRGIQTLELWSVNSLGWPFHSGLWLWLALLTLLAVLALAVAPLVPRLLPHHGVIARHWCEAVWCAILFGVGYSVWLIIPIRGAAATPLSTGIPEDIFSFSSYLLREQYGKGAPLLYGDTPYAQRLLDEEFIDSIPVYRKYHVEKEEPRWRMDRKAGRYVPAPSKKTFATSPETKMLLPRITSSKPDHIRGYADWAGMDSASMARVEISYAVDSLGRPVGRLLPDGSRHKASALKPTTIHNLQYFLAYQTGYMYGRYFLWNFVGRQNDVMTAGEADAGNFITGVPILDDAMLGPQSLMPSDIGDRNPGRNRYLFLPLIAGILGMVWQFRQQKPGRRQFTVVFALFMMTGLAIVVYLNQTPGEARDRDYAFLGSYMAWCIWIGLAVNALAAWLRSPSLKSRVTDWIAVAFAATVPALMVAQNWDDHDRSGRDITAPIARSILAALPQDAILFTDGDNYTFPLWYIQDVEGYRRDVRVVNRAYMITSWYARHLMTPNPGAKAVTLAGSLEHYLSGRLNPVNFLASPDTVDAGLELVRIFQLPDSVKLSIHRYLRMPAGQVIDLKNCFGAKPQLFASDILLLDMLANAGDRPIFISPALRNDVVGMARPGADVLARVAARHGCFPSFSEGAYIDHITRRMLEEYRQGLLMAAMQTDSISLALDLALKAERLTSDNTLPILEFRHFKLFPGDAAAPVVSEALIVADIWRKAAVGQPREVQSEMLRHADSIQKRGERRHDEYLRYYRALDARKRNALKSQTLLDIAEPKNKELGHDR